MNVKLKPCPFCGSKYQKPFVINIDYIWVVKCPTCLLTFGAGETEEGVIKDWNTRGKNDKR